MAGKPKTLSFIKMEALGNDCIVIDGLRTRFQESPRFVRKLCHRQFGIGADQLLLLTKSRKADFKMRVFNADGSEAEMCGNGIRCAALYIRNNKYSKKKDLVIETLAGLRKVYLHTKAIEVNLGEPILKGKDIPANLSGRIINRPLKVDTKEFRITCLSLGNPHCVIFVESVDTFPVERFGPLLENHHLFPRRVNVSFASLVGPDTIKVRVWERGAGETLACGTGAGAVVVASVLNGYTSRKAKIQLPGGDLEVHWDKESNSVSISGPAEEVFEGSYCL